MGDLLSFVLVIVGSLVASTLAAVTGFGSAAVLLPVLVLVFGAKAAVPILAVAQLIGNGSRVWFNRKEVDYKVVRWFAMGSVPAALIGGFLFAAAPFAALTRLLGIFLLLMVAHRHAPTRKPPTMRLKWFAPLGAVTSVLSALLGTTGPLVAPFFLAYGLVKGAYIGTEALAAFVVHTTKLAAYGGMAVLSLRDAFIGVLIGPILVLGSFLGKQIVNRVSERAFGILVEVVLVVAGLSLLLHG